MNRHVAGPWINDGDTISALADPENSPNYIAPVCYIDTDWKPEIIRANGRLVAAAPDLLHALRLMLREHDALQLAAGSTEDRWTAATIARAAINKAEGLT